MNILYVISQIHQMNAEIKVATEHRIHNTL